MHAAAAPAAGLTRPEIRKQILHLAWPVIAEQVLTSLANMVDAMLIGRLSAVAVAAIGLTQPVSWLSFSLFMGLGVGVNALLSRFYGAGERERLAAGTLAGLWLGLLCGGAIGLLLYLLAPQILLAMGARADTAPLGVIYLRWLVPGLVMVFLSFLMTAALRATGDTRTPLLINVAVNLINVPLSLVLIFGYLGAPALGLAGAAIATSASRIVGGLLLLAILLTRRQGAQLAWRSLHRVDLELIRRILRVGIASSSERMFSTLIYIGYARMVATLGTLAMAAHTITVVAENISWMLSSGFALATAAMVGQRLGAGRPEQAEAVIREAVRMGIALLSGLGLCFILLPGPYIAIFTNDAAVRALSVGALRIAGFTEAATALVLVLNGALSGAGDTRSLFWVNVGGGMARLGIAAALIFLTPLGLAGAWLGASADWLVRSALIWRRYRSGAWKDIQV